MSPRPWTGWPTSTAPTAGPEGRPGGPAGGAAQAAAAGRGIFQQRCQNCHGAQGRGARAAPMLTNLNNSSDGDLYQTIHDGRNNRMPPFGMQLSDAQITGIIAYLRHLGPPRQ